MCEKWQTTGGTQKEDDQKKIELASSERSETTVDSHKRIGCYEKRAAREQQSILKIENNCLNF